MLVLTRKLQEQILISENIKITVLRVKGNSVRIGIEAPREVRIVRAELPLEKRQGLEPSRASAQEPTLDVPPAVGKPTSAMSSTVEETDEAGVAVRRPPLAGFISSIEASAV